MGQRYSKSDYLNGKFYQLSKELFKGKYKSLTNNERVLYSVLKDRFELSIKNEWVDSDNNIYFIFEQVQLSEECCMSLKTVQRAMQNLVKYQLIDSVRQGQNMANRLYLLKPDQEEDKVTNDHNEESKAKEKTKSFEKAKDKVDEKIAIKPDYKRTSQNDLSEQVKKSLPDKSKSPTIYTNNNYTENNYTSSSKDESQINRTIEEEESKTTDLLLIKSRIKLEILIAQRKDIPEDLIIKIYKILDSFFRNVSKTSFKIQDEVIPVKELKEQIYNILDQKSFLCVAEAIMNNPGTIKQMRPYIISCFYNYATGEMRSKCNVKKNIYSFNNFEQHNYNFAEIERLLLKN